MARTESITSRLRTDKKTGFGVNSSMYGGRLINKDGTPNMTRRGIPLLERYSWYHTMLSMPRHKFFLVLLGTYVIINLLFAMIYYLIGTEHLVGMIASNATERFLESFFFSTQTFTTVGYGRISPVGFLTSAVATFESFLGLLNFAIATGLFYGRFSRPRAFIKFSEESLIAPYEDGVAFMFRLAPYKNNYLTNAEVKLTLALIVEENGKKANKFYPLDLEIDKVNALNLSWTVVHPISEESPFYQLRSEDLIRMKAEVIVFLQAFDDTFSNTVVARSSYLAEEIVFGGKFVLMYHRSEDGKRTVLDVGKLGTYDPAHISFAYPPLVEGEIKSPATLRGTP
jgi:Inward rectifier potassium channel C-terminal domain/Ion channel